MNDPTRTLAADVTAFCEQRFTDVGTIAELALPTLSGSAPQRSALAIERHCLDLMRATDPPLAGAGVVVAPHVLADEPYWLEWWLPSPDEASAEAVRLTADVNPASVTFRDYTSLAWFEEPRRTGQRGITGPYVDYLCTDQYTLTFTAPLLVDDRFLGVAGVDVLARWFEQYLFVLADGRQELDEGCVVVNRSGRVVACPSGAWVTGDLVRELAAGQLPAGGWHVEDCPGTPFVVARKAG